MRVRPAVRQFAAHDGKLFQLGREVRQPPLSGTPFPRHPNNPASVLSLNAFLYQTSGFFCGVSAPSGRLALLAGDASAFTSTIAQRMGEHSGLKMRPASASGPTINAIGVSLLAFGIVGCSG
jgi:hypothetical protein